MKIKELEQKIIARMKDADKKELVLDIMLIQHLRNYRELMITADIAAGALAVIPAMIVNLTTVGTTLLFSIGGIAGLSFVKDYMISKRLDNLMNDLITELMSKFGTPQMAYIEVSQLITSVTREEILEHFKLMGCEYSRE